MHELIQQAQQAAVALNALEVWRQESHTLFVTALDTIPERASLAQLAPEIASLTHQISTETPGAISADLLDGGLTWRAFFRTAQPLWPIHARTAKLVSLWNEDSARTRYQSEARHSLLTARRAFEEMYDQHTLGFVRNALDEATLAVVCTDPLAQEQTPAVTTSLLAQTHRATVDRIEATWMEQDPWQALVKGNAVVTEILAIQAQPAKAD